MARTVLERISKHLDFQLTEDLLDQGNQDCWIWRGAADPKTARKVDRFPPRKKKEWREPTPVMKLDKKRVNPARILFDLKHGPQSQMLLRSQCPESLCINPDHKVNAKAGEAQ